MIAEAHCRHLNQELSLLRKMQSIEHKHHIERLSAPKHAPPKDLMAFTESAQWGQLRDELVSLRTERRPFLASARGLMVAEQKRVSLRPSSAALSCVVPIHMLSDLLLPTLCAGCKA